MNDTSDASVSTNDKIEMITFHNKKEAPGISMSG